MDKQPHSPTTRAPSKKGLSDDMVDGIVAVLLIALAVSGVVYWLHTMP